MACCSLVVITVGHLLSVLQDAMLLRRQGDYLGVFLAHYQAQLLLTR